MRLIDADTLFAEFENVDWYNNADRDEIAERLVLQAPTIDAVSVVQGEWINKHEWSNGFFERECSVCGAMKPQLMHTAKINFCPNCGARMKGADDE